MALRTRATRVVVVDDADDVRALVSMALDRSGVFHVVAEGSSGADAVALTREHRPDVVLLDVSMPDVDGLEALPRILETSPGTRVVMFSGFDTRGVASAAIQLGAAGYIEKEIAIGELAGRLRSLIPGERARRTAQLALEDLEQAQAVLAQHVERFRMAFEQAAIGMATLTLSGHLVRVNRVLCQLVGAEEHDLIGTPFDALVHPSERLVVAEELAALVRGESEVVGVERCLAAGAWVTLTASVVRDDLARPLYAFLQAADVTRRRRADQRLRASIEGLLDGYAILSPVHDPGGDVVDLRIDFLNRRGRQAAGLEDVDGLTIRSALPALAASDLFDECRRLAAGAAADLHLTHLADGRAFEVAAVDLGDGVGVTWREVTHRRNAAT